MSGQKTIQQLKASYRTGEADLLSEFFDPCLRYCTRYSRAAGYFRSSALVSWAGILPRLAVGEDVSIRLLISPDVGEAEVAAFRNATDVAERSRLRSVSADKFLLDVLKVEPGAMAGDDRLQLLAWLIANDHLEIRFAFPEHLDNPGEYHEKLGIYEFPWGDELAFSGSANESISGHRRNWESIDVYRSWELSERERIQRKRDQFEESWHGDTEGLETLSLSIDALERIKASAPAERPVGSAVQRASNEYELFSHQREALEAWKANGNRGLLEMCTGSGKTITAIDAIRYVAGLSPTDGRSAQRGTVAVIACPTMVLVEQWESEIRKWNPDWLILKAYEDIKTYASKLRTWLNHTDDRTYVVIVTYATLLEAPFLSRLRRFGPGLGSAIFVADEAHNLSSPRALEALAEILPSFAASLALTATPEIEAYPERTEKLLALCGGNVFSYTIENAIKAGVLCPYYYYPRPVFLSPEVSHKYLKILHNLDGAEANKTLELYREKRELLRKSGLYVAELDRLLGELTASDESSLKLTVVYSPPGYDHDSDTRIIERVKGEFEKRRLMTGVIVGGTPRAARQTTLSAFRNGTFPILLGIGCLDEGLDIPETRRSIILYSFDRKKQFIQRRGRVLRTAPGKEAAEIYDLILLPRGAELSESEAERILERELRRYREFAEGALNPDEASAVLDNALQTN